jgi:hypothetical protein
LCCGAQIFSATILTLIFLVPGLENQEEYKVAVLRERLILPMVIFEPKNWK